MTKKRVTMRPVGEKPAGRIFIPIHTCRSKVDLVEKGGRLRGRKIRNLTVVRETRYCARRPNPVTTDEIQQDPKLIASTKTRLILRRVTESPGAYPPLKTVAEGLCFVLDNWEVCLLPCVHSTTLTVVLANRSE